MKTHIPSAPASRCCSRLSKWWASASCAASCPCPWVAASACVDNSPLLENRSLESGLLRSRVGAARVADGVAPVDGLVRHVAGADDLHLLDGPELVGLPRHDR